MEHSVQVEMSKVPRVSSRYSRCAGDVEFVLRTGLMFVIRRRFAFTISWPHISKRIFLGYSLPKNLQHVCTTTDATLPYLDFTMYRTTCQYLSAPTKVGPGIVNDNVLGCLGTVRICSLRLFVTTENLGDHAHGRLWVESQGAGDVENKVFCNLQCAMPNVATISLLTQPFAQNDRESGHPRNELVAMGNLMKLENLQI